MKAKMIKALDTLIAAIEEVKDAVSEGASKSGDDADDADSGEVSGRKGKAGARGVSAAGKKSRAVPDDDTDVDGETDPEADDAEEDLPPPKRGVAAKKAATKPAAKAGKKKPAEDDEVSLDTVKEKLTAVMNEESLGKPKVLAVLKKFGAAKSTELDESDYEAVCTACDKLMATVDAEV